MKINKLPKKLNLKDVDILDPLKEKVFKGSILIVNGKISEVGKFEQPSDVKSIDCNGLTLTHGFCDLHAHFREPGGEDKETLMSGSRAALAGGFTRVCVMPNTSPPIDSPESISFIIQNSKDCPIHIHPIGAVTRGQKGKEITEMGLMYQAGSVAFSDDGLPIQNGLVMRKALEYSKMIDVPIINHAEDVPLRNDGLMNESSLSTKLGLDGNPDISESVMVFRDLEIAEYVKGRIHIPHVSTAKSVEIIKNYKSKGVNVTAEVTPHHIGLTEKSLINFDTNAKVAPPLRTENDCLALIEGLRDGTITCIATDHAPHTIEEKEKDFKHAPCGMIGLESAFALTYTTLIKNDFTIENIIGLFTSGPASVLGWKINPFEIGQKAEIVVIDLDADWNFSKKDIFLKSKNSPMLGMNFKSQIIKTICGKNIFEKK